MTFDWQENDIKMAQFMYDKMAPIAKAMNPKLIAGSPKNANSHFDTTSYQTTHMNGGAVMGEDPKTSAVNRYLQSWDVHNVFSIGASAFPQGAGLQPDRHRGGAGLLVCPRYSRAVSEKPRPIGAGIRTANDESICTGTGSQCSEFFRLGAGRHRQQRAYQAR